MGSGVSKTTDRDNFSRFGNGIVGVGSSMVQDTLAFYIPSSILPTIVNISHPVWRRLNPQQRTLVTKAATDGYEQFDISLTYTLLRNVCTYFIDPNKPTLPTPTRGWDRDPQPTDLTLSDDLERLRSLRNNVYGHLAQAKIPDNEYRTHWLELKDIAVRMQNVFQKDYPAELTKLETYKLNDMSVKQLINRLEEHKDDLENRLTDIKDDLEVLKKRSDPATKDPVNTDEQANSLRQVLIETNQEETQNVLLAPLEQFSRLPVDMIYAPVSIRKDLENTLRRQHIVGKEKAEVDSEPVSRPEDIFMKNGRPTRFIMMQGEAGRGKSVYCQQLMKYWCNAKNAGASKKKLSDWEKRLGEFYFLFLVKLRHVFTNVTSLVDMICDDIDLRGYPGYRETIRHVLSSDKYTSLILVDGLDEWKLKEQASSQPCCIPHTRGISNSSTIFFTMRPWKFDSVALLIKTNDRVLEIKGLEKDGIVTIAEKVLVNYFELDPLSPEYESQLNEIKRRAQNEKLKSLLQVPLIAVVSVILWYNKEDVGDCMTTFYIALVRMLIERAIENKTVDQNIAQKKKNVFSTDEIPKILFGEKMLKQFIHVLLGLGEIAYRDLMSKETRLVFEKVEIEEQLGKSELKFALKVGLLTQSDAPGPAHKKHVSINFFHKSVQEFLMAVYVSSKKNSCKLLLENLSSIEAVIEYENIIMFVSGLSPFLGYKLSQHIVSLTHSDPDICRYRETFHYKTHNKVKLIYHLQLSCLRELKLTDQHIPHTTQQRDYHISDVYVDDYSDTDTVRMTADVLRHHNNNIVSLHIDIVPNDRQDGTDDAVIHDYLQQTTTLTSLYIHDYSNNRTLHTINTVTSLKALLLAQLSITPSLLHDIQTSLHNNTHIHRLGLLYNKCVDSGEVRHDSVQTLTTSFCGLLQNLPSCKHLSWLDISYMLKKEERDMLVNVLPHLSHLKDIEYAGSTYYDVDDGEYDYTIVHMVSQWTQLQALVLGYISLGDRSLELTADMDHIELVGLYTVKMSAGGWGKFITSLINIQHQFEVELDDTDISADCVTIIRSSPHFTVTRHEEGKSKLVFARKFPPTS